MEKIPSLIVAFLITLLVAFNFFIFHGFSEDLEKVVIIRVIDGDTVVLEDGRTIRLLNVNAPEKNSFAADKAASFLRNYENHTIELQAAGIEKYGRTLGRLYGPEYLNLELVELGFSSIFLVDDKELKDFHKAQELAVSQGLGIWQHSQYYGCLKARAINKEEEFVVLEKSCQVSIQGWTLKDESTKTYKFKQNKEGNFTLWSGEGVEGLSWNKGSVWNNDRDSLFIRDSEGKLVYYESYGY